MDIKLALCKKCYSDKNIILSRKGVYQIVVPDNNNIRVSVVDKLGDFRYISVFPDKANEYFDILLDIKEAMEIISDNLKFHGHVGNRNNIASRNLKQLVGKIENYIDFLKENEEFETKFYDVGDGLSVSIRKNDI